MDLKKQKIITIATTALWDSARSTVSSSSAWDLAPLERNYNQKALSWLCGGKDAVLVVFVS